MASHFNASSVAYPLHEDEFRHLDKADRKKLLKLMARIAESAYRRGYQHGRVFDPSRDLKPVYEFRFYQSLANARGPDGGAPMSSIDRLQCEHGQVLNEIGLRST